MKPLAYPLLTDENIHPKVIEALRMEERDVRTAVELELAGRPDREVLRCAVSEGRVVVTHDSDFGQLTIQGGQSFVGIVYLRPGHIDSRVVLQNLAAIEATVGNVEAGFIVVAEHRAGQVRIRLRRPD